MSILLDGELLNEVRIINDKYQKLFAIEAIEKIKEKMNPHKVGDIIEDHIGFGRVIETYVHISQFNYRSVDIYYKCDNLTKKLEIHKRDPKRTIYHSNLK